MTDGHQKSLIGEVYYWHEGEKVNISAGLRSTYQYASNLYGVNEEVNLKNYNAYPYVQLQGSLGKYLIQSELVYDSNNRSRVTSR